MQKEMSAAEKAMIEQALKQMQDKNRHRVPHEKVKLFLVMVGAELKKSGSVKKEYVDDVVAKIKAGAL